MPRPNPARRSALPRCWLALPFLAALLLSSCATAPVSHRSLAGAQEKVPKLHVVVAPLDAELAELTAGGITERRDDWTDQAVANLTAALTAETGWAPASTLSPEQQARVRAETEDVQALLRAITLNHLVSNIPGRAGPPFPVKTDGLTYQTGALKEHAAALGEGGVLFVFVRDSYATAGRKSLLALSVIGAAFTGVAIVPMMGSDVMSAALVESDGTVLWCNFQIGGADPRTPEGAREVAKKLLAGLPKKSA